MRFPVDYGHSGELEHERVPSMRVTGMGFLDLIILIEEFGVPKFTI